MEQAIKSPQKMQKGRGWGLLIAWRRELGKKLQIKRYLPGKSQGATLAIMAQMDQHPGRRPGVDKETYCDLDQMNSKSTRTQCLQTGIRTEVTPQWWSNTWPQCLGRGAPTCRFRPPLPTPLTTSSDSSGLPSLESLTDPESGYETSASSTLSPNMDWITYFIVLLSLDPNLFSLLGFLLLHFILISGAIHWQLLPFCSFLPLFL